MMLLLFCKGLSAETCSWIKWSLCLAEAAAALALQLFDWPAHASSLAAAVKTYEAISCKLAYATDHSTNFSIEECETTLRQVGIQDALIAKTCRCVLTPNELEKEESRANQWIDKNEKLFEDLTNEYHRRDKRQLHSIYDRMRSSNWHRMRPSAESGIICSYSHL